MSKATGKSIDTARNLFPLIAKRLDSIPTIPLVLDGLLAAARSRECSAAELAELVERDPALTAKVLKVMGSQFYGLRFKITTIAHAIAMLGQSALLKLAAGIRTCPAAAEDETVLDKERFWMHSVAVAAAARQIAMDIGYDLPNEAWTAGLIHDIGKVVVDLYSPAECMKLIEDGEREGKQTAELERSLLGADHGQVGALVADQWNLPRLFKDVIQFHHHAGERVRGFPEKSRKLISVVGAADWICWKSGLGCCVEGSGWEGANEEGLLKISPEAWARAADAARSEVLQTARRLGVDVGAVSDLPEALRRQGPAPRGPRRPAPDARGLAKRIAAVNHAVRRAREEENVDMQIEGVIARVSGALGFDRLLFLDLDREEERLRGRILNDDTHMDVNVRGISLPLNPDGLVGAALREGVCQRVDNWATDGDLLNCLGVLEVAVAPVIANQKPFGVICGDLFFSNTEIQETEIALLDMLAVSLGVAMDNIALNRQATRLRSLAAKDPLTGINNRRNLMLMLQKEIDRGKRYGSPLAVVMVDIDHFKTFNDNFGHQAGDTILAEVAQLIVASSRDIDVIGRYGGEEFMVVLPETHVDQAIVYAERLRATVEQFGRDRRNDYPGCHLTISAGVTALKREQDDIEELIRRVDHALYAAKERGRNRVCVD